MRRGRFRFGGLFGFETGCSFYEESEVAFVAEGVVLYPGVAVHSSSASWWASR